jgi:hypothetical protein
VEKYDIVIQTTDDNIMRHRKNVVCLPDNEGRNTDRNAEYLKIVAVPRQQLPVIY